MSIPSTSRPTASPSPARSRAARGVSLPIEQGYIHNWDWPEAAYDVVVAIFIQFSPEPERAEVFAGLSRRSSPAGSCSWKAIGRSSSNTRTARLILSKNS